MQKSIAIMDDDDVIKVDSPQSDQDRDDQREEDKEEKSTRKSDADDKEEDEDKVKDEKDDDGDREDRKRARSSDRDGDRGRDKDDDREGGERVGNGSEGSTSLLVRNLSFDIRYISPHLFVLCHFFTSLFYFHWLVFV